MAFFKGASRGDMGPGLGLSEVENSKNGPPKALAVALPGSGYLQAPYSTKSCLSGAKRSRAEPSGAERSPRRADRYHQPTQNRGTGLLFLAESTAFVKYVSRDITPDQAPSIPGQTPSIPDQAQEAMEVGGEACSGRATPVFDPSTLAVAPRSRATRPEVAPVWAVETPWVRGGRRN